MFLFRRKVARMLNRRGHYRTKPSDEKPLGVQLVTPSGAIDGELIDVSVRGCGARFLFAKDPMLSAGDVVEIRISSERRDEVRTPVRVVYGVADGETHLRYGFQFINAGNLYGQLDDFYVRVFNRRRSPRVRPQLDEKIPVTLSWNRQELVSPVHELSAHGLGMILPQPEAFRLGKVDELRVEFSLPEVKKPFGGPARIRNRKPVLDKVFLGLEFDLDAPDGLGARQPELQEFVEQRAERLGAWEESLA